jgi:hypothetical protein
VQLTRHYEVGDGVLPSDNLVKPRQTGCSELIAMESHFHSVNEKQELLHASCVKRLGKSLFLTVSNLSLNATSLPILGVRCLSLSQLLPLCASFSASRAKSCCSHFPVSHLTPRSRSPRTAGLDNDNNPAALDQRRRIARDYLVRIIDCCNSLI